MYITDMEQFHNDVDSSVAQNEASIDENFLIKYGTVSQKEEYI